MNERIRELAEQAGWCIVDDDEFSTYFGKFAEKFAELIVRECAAYAFSDDQDHKAMLNHFGVKQ
jgi:hypothetical protein